MWLIDADKLIERYPEIADIVATAPTEDAIELPFKPGDSIWYVDEEDGYKIKKYKEVISGVAYFGDGDFQMISSDGEYYPPDGPYCCLSIEQAMEIREQMLSQLTLKDMEKSIRYSNMVSPEEWGPFMEEVKELFLKKVDSLL